MNLAEQATPRKTSVGDHSPKMPPGFLTETMFAGYHSLPDFALEQVPKCPPSPRHVDCLLDCASSLSRHKSSALLLRGMSTKSAASSTMSQVAMPMFHYVYARPSKFSDRPTSNSARSSLLAKVSSLPNWLINSKNVAIKFRLNLSLPFAKLLSKIWALA